MRNNSEILYIKKPEWLSWDAVQLCQAKAHERNKQNGLNMHCSELTGAELAESLKDGICYVALKGDQVVGTCSLIIQDGTWFFKNKRVGYLAMAGVLPEYQGTEVYFELQKLRMKDIKDQKVEILYFDTAENNALVRKMNAKQGFKPVYYICFKSTDYYSVTMAKWLIGKPKSELWLKIYFWLSEKFVKLRYKPGRIKRFGI